MPENKAQFLYGEYSHVSDLLNSNEALTFLLKEVEQVINGRIPPYQVKKFLRESVIASSMIIKPMPPKQQLQGPRPS